MIDNEQTRRWLEEREHAQQAFLAEQAELNRKHQSRMVRLLLFAVPVAMVSTMMAGGIAAFVAIFLAVKSGFESDPATGPKTIQTSSGPVTQYGPPTTYEPSNSYAAPTTVYVPASTDSQPIPTPPAFSVPVTRPPLPSPSSTPQPAPDPISAPGVAPASYIDAPSTRTPR